MIEFRNSSIYNIHSSFIRLFGVVVFLILIVSPGKLPAQTRHTVRWVNDGDTIVLKNGQRIRYIGVNAPEIDHENQKAQPYGYQAKSFNQNLVMSRKIRLRYDIDRYDRYGRELAYIFLEDGTFVNAKLLRSGMAFYLYRKPNLKYDKILLKAQLKAMDRDKGIWQNWAAEKRKYIGNQNSHRFHSSSCAIAAKINAMNLIHFSSKWDAFRSGYAPSKECIPKFWSYSGEE